MKRMMIISAVMLSMFMASSNVNAQRQSKERDHNRMERRNNPGKGKRDGYRPHAGKDRRQPAHIADAPKHGKHHAPKMAPRGGRFVKCEPPRVNRGCYVPGWEGRVRYHHDGRWGYFVDGSWRYYDCYYNPYDYFCEPQPPHAHHAPMVHAGHASAGEVAAGVAIGTILGCIIGSVAN